MPGSMSACLTTRLLGAAALALTAASLTASHAVADSLPLPLPTPVTDQLAPVLGSLGASSPAAPSGAPAALSPGTVSAPAGAPAAVPHQAPSSPGASGWSRSTGSSAPASPVPAGTLDLTVNAAPLVNACLQVAGSGTSLANTTIMLGTTNISSQFVEGSNGLLSHCPSAATGPQEPGTVVTAAAAVTDLDGACVQVFQAGPPVKATVLVLDHELVDSLTAAGVPLAQLVVPCPANTGVGGDVTPGGGGGGGIGGDGTSGPGGTGVTGVDGASSALTAGTVRAASALPHTGADIAEWIAAAVALLLGGAGLTLVSRARGRMVPISQLMSSHVPTTRR